MASFKCIMTFELSEILLFKPWLDLLIDSGTDDVDC